MAPSTRLHLRFAAATAAVIATAGAGLLWFAADNATKHAQRDIAAHARFVEETSAVDALIRLKQSRQ